MDSITLDSSSLQSCTKLSLHKLNLTSAKKDPVNKLLGIVGITQSKLKKTKNSVSKYYDKSVKSFDSGAFDGLTIHSRDTKKKDSGKYLIEINGGTLDRVDLATQLLVVKVASKLSLRFTTVHIKLRDTNYKEHGYCLDDVAELLGLLSGSSDSDSESVVTNVRRFRTGRVWRGNSGKVESLNIGSCTSSVYVHIYQAITKHGVNAIDWEFRVKGNECNKLMNDVATVVNGVDKLYCYIIELLQFTEDVKDSPVSKFWHCH